MTNKWEWVIYQTEADKFIVRSITAAQDNSAPLPTGCVFAGTLFAETAQQVLDYVTNFSTAIVLELFDSNVGDEGEVICIADALVFSPGTIKSAIDSFMNYLGSMGIPNVWEDPFMESDVLVYIHEMLPTLEIIITV